MVYLSRVVHGAVTSAIKRRKFLDSLRIHVRGGTGGMGYPKFGGIGGKGGDVYVEAAEISLKQVITKHPSKRVIAGTGENSKTYKILGSPGKDVVIEAPVGVTVVNDNKRVLGDLNQVGDKVLVARGGPGGTPQNQFCGAKGENLSIILDLKLIADVGFVGFPNAGKSTLLKALSRASPKIASYPFTTIEPNIGIMEYDDHRQISVADLPGLIEGAHLNYGMGHKFLKHVVRTKMLLFVVDVCGFQLSMESPVRTAFETVVLLNKELELYKDDLVLKPALLVVTKLDLEGADERLETLLLQLKNMEELKKEFPGELRPDRTVVFDDVIPICATKAHNVDLLRSKIRHFLDFHYEERRQEKEKSLTEDLSFKILV